MFGWEGNLRKISLLTALMILISVFFGGCGMNGDDSEKNGADRNVEYSAGYPVSDPKEITYVVINSIEIEEHQEDAEGNPYDINSNEAGNFRYNYVTIQGLADEGIEDQVNSLIKDTFDELKEADVPPYRGIKKEMPQNGILSEEILNCWVGGNFNNILSVRFIKMSYFTKPVSSQEASESGQWDQYEEIVSFEDIRTLNIDLNTGKTIDLQSVFSDGTDMEALLNQKLMELLPKGDEAIEYEEEWGTVTYGGNRHRFYLSEPISDFSKLKFTLDENGVQFYFDYSTPEVVGSYRFYYDNLEISYSHFPKGSVAVAERYYDGTNIYKSEEPQKKQLVYYSGSGLEGKDTLSVQENYENAQISRIFIYDHGVPGELKAMAEEQALKYPGEEYRNKFGRRINASEGSRGESENSFEFEGGGNEASIYSSVRVTVTRFGNYYSYRLDASYYDPDESYEIGELKCFDLSGKELQISDVFFSGYDYESEILKEIKSDIENYSVLSYTDADQEARRILDTADGLFLDARALFIMGTGNMENGEPMRLSFYVPYEIFNSDYMTIFN